MTYLRLSCFIFTLGQNNNGRDNQAGSDNFGQGDRFSPYRELIEHGIHVAGSSDCPVVSPDPILGMRDSIMRKTEEGRVLAPSQRLDADMAFRMYTQEAAFSIFQENNIGTIEEGKLADMVVLSENPLSTSPASWSDKLRVEMTIVGGDIVYENF